MHQLDAEEAPEIPALTSSGQWKSAGAGFGFGLLDPQPIGKSPGKAEGRRAPPSACFLPEGPELSAVPLIPSACTCGEHQRKRWLTLLGETPPAPDDPLSRAAGEAALPGSPRREPGPGGGSGPGGARRLDLRGGSGSGTERTGPLPPTWERESRLQRGPPPPLAPGAPHPSRGGTLGGGLPAAVLGPKAGAARRSQGRREPPPPRSLPRRPGRVRAGSPSPQPGGSAALGTGSEVGRGPRSPSPARLRSPATRGPG